MRRGGPLSRKTPLTAKTPLRNRVGLSRGTRLSSGRISKGTKRSELVERKPAPKDTGPTRQVRHTVKARAAMCCERCSVPVAAMPHEVHHRRPRGAGGSSRPDTNLPSNLVLLCGTSTSGCHGFCESERDAAREEGFLVRQGADPALQPVLHARFGRVLLDAAGGVTPYREAAA
jgi:hypothetical protein